MSLINQVVLTYGNFAAPLPQCAEVLVMVKQTQTFGGASVNDGMAQSGPAVAARAAFIAGLQSYVADNLNGRTPSTTVKYNIDNPLSLFSGAGTLIALVPDNEEEFITGTWSVLVNNVVTGSNGRFNATENASGLWYEADGAWEITLTSPKTAFGCYVMDTGDFREAECEFKFYNGGTLVRTIQLPTVFADKPRSNEAMWVGYADGNQPFDKVHCEIWQHSANPGARDISGFDGFIIGECVSCTATATPIVHYGANTTSDAAKTVTGAALTARNAWLAAVTSSGVCDFEANTVGSVGVTTPIAFTGVVSGSLATISCNQYSADHTTVAASTTDVIDNNGASARWNTTAGGAKWYEFTDELVIQFASGIKAVGFYVTDLGDQNATLRVTLRRADGSGVAYYLPKATALPGDASLLRFWGVTGEVEFTQVVLQTVYYTELIAGVYDNPVFHVKGTPDIVGIDDLLIGH
jgi:hypothetical protein